jgi:acyl carrier protein
MNFNEITIETISSYIKNVKKEDREVKLESHLVNDLNIDSLDVIELCFLIEEKHKIKVNLEEMMTIQLPTVQEVANFFKRNHDQSV